MRYFQVLCFGIVLCSCANLSLAENTISIEPFTPSKIHAAIHVHGADAVITYVFRDISRRSIFLENISKGNEEWLKVFPSLRNVSDAGWSWMMNGAIADALDTNPRKALSAISQVNEALDYAKKVCGETEEDWIEDKPVQSLAPNAIKTLTRRKKGLDNQKGPVADKCADAIDSRILWWEKRRNPGN